HPSSARTAHFQWPVVAALTHHCGPVAGRGKRHCPHGSDCSRRLCARGRKHGSSPGYVGSWRPNDTIDRVDVACHVQSVRVIEEFGNVPLTRWDKKGTLGGLVEEGRVERVRLVLVRVEQPIASRRMLEEGEHLLPVPPCHL